MFFFIALSVSLAAATALLLHQFRSRTLAAADAPAEDAGEGVADERQAA